MKTSCKVATFLVACALVCNTVKPAKAWLDGNAFSPERTFHWDWIPIPVYQPTYTYQPPINSGTGKSRGKGNRRPKVRKGSGASKRPSLVRTSFRPSAAVRKRNFAQFVAKTRASDPQGADQLEQTLASSDIIGTMGKQLAPFGFKTNDVADAMTVYLIEAWNGVQGRSDNPSRTRRMAVRRQIAAAVQATPQFAHATDAQKQELAEAMLIQAALLDAAVEGAKSDPQTMAKVKAAIAAGAKRTFGLDLKSARLTDAGMVVTKASLQG
jgi:hypothetical protein